MGKQVKTPRFYVDMVTFLHATGQLGWDDGNGGAELLYMNCANPFTKQVDTTSTNEVARIGNHTNNTTKTSFPVNFCALLNHNLGSNDSSFKVYGKYGLTSTTTDIKFTPANEILNSSHASDAINPTYNGTTIFDFASDNQYWRSFSIYYGLGNEIVGTQQLGSLVLGKYFDCPNSPDLNLTMSRRFDGIKRQKTVGGKTLANIYYDGPTEWTMNNADGTTYKYPPFELDTTGTDFDQRVKSGIGRKGLRSWKLTFSYISESDMWIDNEVSNTLISDGESTPENNDPNPMLSDNSFNFVWNCTLGGTLPFIFTDDKDSNEPDRYAICNFRENSLSVQQVAHNAYKVSMTIDEIA